MFRLFWNTSDNLRNSCQLPLYINIFHSCTEQKPSSRNYCVLRLELTLPIQRGPEHSQLDILGKGGSADIDEMLNKSYLDVKFVQRGQQETQGFADRFYMLKPASIIRKHHQHTFLQQSPTICWGIYNQHAMEPS